VEATAGYSAGHHEQARRVCVRVRDAAHKEAAAQQGDACSEFTYECHRKTLI